ncbi:MAG TPA: hypothetical protein VHH73_13880, partial [Verrucomicrobiae bacterium]|nr:hypothetical protein [Verrucomicrobiae bacterium]
TIAESSVDILLNRNLSALQSLIDQFTEIQGIKYVYITDESGEFIAHTFVPGVPEEIRKSHTSDTNSVVRRIAGMGEFVEVGSPILTGVGGFAHVGMDRGLIALKIQRAIGRQVYLISIIFVIGIFTTVWLVNLAAKPLNDLMAYAVRLATPDSVKNPALADDKLLSRDDEVGQLARLFLYFSKIRDEEKAWAEKPGENPESH